MATFLNQFEKPITAAVLFPKAQWRGLPQPLYSRARPTMVRSKCRCDKQEWRDWVRLMLRAGRKGPALWQILRRCGKKDPPLVDPEFFLEASFETFILMLVVCWVMTYFFNWNIIFKRNLLFDIVGYNNLCVGFDTAPAFYVAQPLMVVQAYFAVRYAALDIMRSSMLVNQGRLTKPYHVFTVFANVVYGFFMICWVRGEEGGERREGERDRETER